MTRACKFKFRVVRNVLCNSTTTTTTTTSAALRFFRCAKLKPTQQLRAMVLPDVIEVAGKQYTIRDGKVDHVPTRADGKLTSMRMLRKDGQFTETVEKFEVRVRNAVASAAQARARKEASPAETTAAATTLTAAAIAAASSYTSPHASPASQRSLRSMAWRASPHQGLLHRWSHRPNPSVSSNAAPSIRMQVARLLMLHLRLSC